jgi:hypothetical protein
VDITNESLMSCMHVNGCKTQLFESKRDSSSKLQNDASLSLHCKRSVHKVQWFFLSFFSLLHSLPGAAGFYGTLYNCQPLLPE